MGSLQFLEFCGKLVKDYTIEHMDKSDDIPEFDVYTVWYCKSLQNHKGLFSTSVTDGMYYECTFNDDKNELYLDAYKKFENRCIKIEVND